VNSIIEQLIDTYGNSFLLYIGVFIAFIFSLFLVYRFLKSKGWFKTPLEMSLENVQHGINQMNTFFIESMKDHEVITNMILKNQDYKLSDEQVSILLKDKEYIYGQQLMDICVPIFVKNHISENKDKTINKLRSSIKALVLREDKEYLKLPNVSNGMIGYTEKLRCMDEHDVYTKLYDIMIEFNGHDRKTEDYIRNTKLFLENHISTYWMK